MGGANIDNGAITEDKLAEDVKTKLNTTVTVPTNISAFTNDAGYAKTTEINTTISTEIAKIVAGANEDFDTLKEISDWILAHPESVAELNNKITTNTNAITQNTLDIEDNHSAILQAQLDIQTNTNSISDIKIKDVDSTAPLTVNNAGLLSVNCCPNTITGYTEIANNKKLINAETLKTVVNDKTKIATNEELVEILNTL